MSQETFYAIRSGKSVHISEVESGLACECICGECEGRLIAKKGEIRVHHFAHKDDTSCQSRGESALHLKAKEIIEKERKILVPAIQIKFFSYTLKPLDIRLEAILSLDSVRLEQSTGDFRPDISACVEGHQLFIEPAYSHFIDEEKKDKIQKRGISTLEIDLRGLCDSDPKELAQAIIQEAPRKWIYSKAADYKEKAILSRATRRYPSGGFVEQYVSGCPIPVRRFRGEGSANVLRDCLYCSYGLKYDDGMGVLCGPVQPGNKPECEGF